jgi:hypothetical protein
MIKSRDAFLFLGPLGLTVSIPFLFTLGLDYEGLFSEVASTYLHGQSLKEGVYPFWNHLVGFGVPQTAPKTLTHHPFILLTMYLSMDWALTIFYIFHIYAGITGFWVLCNFLRFNKIVVYLCVFTYAFSPASLNYFFRDFWPTHVVMWTILPWVVLIFLRLISSETKQQALIYSILLGLLGGLTAINGHLGHLSCILVAFVGFALGEWRRSLKNAGWILLSLLISSLIVAPTIYAMSLEFLNLPNSDKRVQPMGSLNIWSLWLWPFDNPSWYSYASNYRDPSIGGPFLILTFFGILFRNLRGRFHSGFFTGVIFGVVFWFLPQDGLFIFSGNLPIRDPLIIFSILIAGSALTSLNKRYLKPPFRQIINLLIVLQVLVISYGALKFTGEFVGKTLTYMSGQPTPIMRTYLQPRGIYDFLRRSQSQTPGRILLTRSVEESIGRNRDFIKHGVFALWNLPVVNGKFFGYSYHQFHPNLKKTIGQITASMDMFSNQALLNVLGIRYIVGTGQDVFPDFLQKIGERQGPDDLVLSIYENHTAWPKATLLNSAVAQVSTLPLREGCGHPGLLCSDWSLIENARILSNGEPKSHIDWSGIHVELPDFEGEIFLFINEHYRPGWKVELGELTEMVTPFLDSLIGVHIPSGIKTLRLAYRPPIQVALESISFFSIFLCIIIASLLVAKNRRPSR